MIANGLNAPNCDLNNPSQIPGDWVGSLSSHIYGASIADELHLQIWPRQKHSAVWLDRYFILATTTVRNYQDGLIITPWPSGLCCHYSAFECPITDKSRKRSSSSCRGIISSATIRANFHPGWGSSMPHLYRGLVSRVSEFWFCAVKGFITNRRKH